MDALYADPEPTRDEIDATPGSLLLEFGAPWCGYCQGAQSLIAQSLAGYPGLAHLQIEDGRGRPLGRSFSVKLWPTLIVLRDGVELARVVRPEDPGSLREALSHLPPAG